MSQRACFEPIIVPDSNQGITEAEPRENYWNNKKKDELQAAMIFGS